MYFISSRHPVFSRPLRLHFASSSLPKWQKVWHPSGGEKCVALLLGGENGVAPGGEKSVWSGAGWREKCVELLWVEKWCGTDHNYSPSHSPVPTKMT